MNTTVNTFSHRVHQWLTNCNTSPRCTNEAHYLQSGPAQRKDIPVLIVHPSCLKDKVYRDWRRAPCPQRTRADCHYGAESFHSADSVLLSADGSLPYTEGVGRGWFNYTPRGEKIVFTRYTKSKSELVSQKSCPGQQETCLSSQSLNRGMSDTVNPLPAALVQSRMCRVYKPLASLSYF